MFNLMTRTFFDTLPIDALVRTVSLLSKSTISTKRWRSGMTDSLPLVYACNGPFKNAIPEISSRLVITFSGFADSMCEDDAVWLIFPVNPEVCKELIQNFGFVFKELSIREFPPRNIDGAIEFLDLIAQKCTHITQLRITSGREGSDRVLRVLIPLLGKRLSSLYIRRLGSFAQLSSESVETIARNCATLKRFSIAGNYGLNDAVTIWEFIGKPIEELELDFQAKRLPNPEFELNFLIHARNIHMHCPKIRSLNIRKIGDKAGYSNMFCAFGERLERLSVTDPGELTCQRIAKICTRAKVSVFGVKGESHTLNAVSSKLSKLSLAIPENINIFVLKAALDKCTILECMELDLSSRSSQDLSVLFSAKKNALSELMIKYYGGSIDEIALQSIASSCTRLQRLEISTKRIDDVDRLLSIARTNLTLNSTRLVEIGQRSEEEAAKFVRTAIASLDKLPCLRKVYIQISLMSKNISRRCGSPLLRPRPISHLSRPNHRADVIVRCSGGKLENMRLNLPWWK